MIQHINIYQTIERAERAIEEESAAQTIKEEPKRVENSREADIMPSQATRDAVRQATYNEAEDKQPYTIAPRTQSLEENTERRSMEYPTRKDDFIERKAPDEKRELPSFVKRLFGKK